MIENMSAVEKADEYTLAEELIHSISHGIGSLLSIAALVLLIVRAATHAPAQATASCVVGFTIFGVTLFILYTMSTLYHARLPHTARFVFKILDHSAIYLLIAGTYTAFCLSILRGSMGWTLFGLIWGLALFGVTMDAVFACRLTWLSIPLYLIMGWLVLIAIKPLLAVIPPLSLTYLVIGGVAYTVGAVFFIIDRKWLHAIWHFFVLAGSITHFFAVFYAV
ncbi:MAG: hemolysin III family protein [Thermoguttaceae bacterium]|nr:hemolysin III family protein [Thermoguttaceae bacterium]